MEKLWCDDWVSSGWVFMKLWCDDWVSSSLVFMKLWCDDWVSSSLVFMKLWCDDRVSSSLVFMDPPTILLKYWPSVHKAFQVQDQDQTQVKYSFTIDFFETYYNYY